MAKSKVNKSKSQLLFQSPYERTTRDTWLIFKIMSEFVDGFELLKPAANAVSIFGSARFTPKSPYWKMAEKVSYAITAAGLSLISGGGPGLMEASNRGARRGILQFKKKMPKKDFPLSVGLSIQLPHESEPNKFLDLEVNFKYFFVRKVMFAKYARAFVILPGGFGTLDELFEALTLIQTHKVQRVPIILMGRKYWSGLMAWIETTLVKEKSINSKDLELIQITDDPDEVVRIIKKFKVS
ncbi:MAG: TIGR00730 family Rossman fold protein [Deltaproteobacteria bacterium]|nr:TIGR00730 family Rossman fold protein [Deltaproteobacteria bacterium]